MGVNPRANATATATAAGGPLPRGESKWRGSPFGGFSIALAILVVFLVTYPLYKLFALSFFPQGHFDALAISQVYRSAWAASTVENTVIIVVISTILSISFGAFLAWLNERTDAGLKGLGEILPLIPLLVPSIAMSIGWIFLASAGSGFINGALDWAFGTEFSLDIATWPGVIFAYSINGVPYAYLTLAGAFRNLDPAIEEASRISGAGAWKTFRRVSLPAIKPAIAAAALLVTVIGFSNYSIAMILAARARIDVISIRIFQLLTIEYPPQYGQATAMCIFVLSIASALWLLQRHFSKKGNFATIGGRASQISPVRLGKFKLAAQSIMIVYFLCAAVLPVFALVVVALQPFWNSTIDPSEFSLGNIHTAFIEQNVTRQAFLNSMMLAGTAALIAISIGAVIALYVRNNRGALGRVADGVTKLPALFSHLSLAVGFLVGFAGAPFYLGGTTWLLLLAYVVIHVPEASIGATAAVGQIGRELIEASEISGASGGRTFRKIITPLMLPGLAASYALIFILNSGEVTVSALLATTDRPVIGYVIRSNWEGGGFGTLAALAVGLALMNCMVVLIFLKIGKMRLRMP